MKLKISYLILFTLIVNIFSANATIRFVSKTGTSTPPYTSWQTAADSIQKCINICVDGDTVYVANGVYKETLLINTAISLIGSSMDSTVISGESSTINRLVDFAQNGSIENFYINGRGLYSSQDGIIGFHTDIIVKNCRIENLDDAIVLFSSTSLVEKCFIKNFIKRAIWDECASNNCLGYYQNNLIISTSSSETPVLFSFGGYPTFNNNIVIEEVYRLTGVDVQYNSGANILNNLVSGYIYENIRIGQINSDTAYVENNISLNSPIAFSTSTGNRTKLLNNIAKDSFTGIESPLSGTTIPDYNLFWNVQELATGNVVLGDSNLVADPMFVIDTIPRVGGTYDYHLQAYSPAIDKGDPNILDKDGTRSDIGMYGGLFGETYTYQDLAPLAPRNLSAVVDTNQILLKWNRSTEADTSFYKVYRDTVVNFTIDSTKLVSSSADTFFVQPNPHINTRYAYKVTCVDNQGNESQPSQELVVNITSVSIDDYPMIISDYLLYQNYPNPFNPSTKIGYQLKERAYVKLIVYDIKGELITVLVNKEQNAGYYEVDFSVGSLQSTVGNSIASGIYLYRIEVIGEGSIPVYTEMKKMLLIK